MATETISRLFPVVALLSDVVIHMCISYLAFWEISKYAEYSFSENNDDCTFV